MKVHSLSGLPRKPAAQPLDEGLRERVRACLNGDWSRAALSSFGVNDKTLLAALAGAPVWPGTRALIREALDARRQPQEAAGGA